MRSPNTWTLSLVLFTIAAFYLVEPVVAAPAQDGSPSVRNAGRPLIEPPGQPADRPPPPPTAEDESGRRMREPGPPPGRGPGAGRGMGRGPGRSGGRAMGRGAGPDRPYQPRHFQMMERLLPLIAKDHPDLARRLVEMRDKAPEEFERVLADALAIRFEEALQRADRDAMATPGPRPPGAPAGPEWDEPQLRGPGTQFFAQETSELEHRNEMLEQQSVELARRCKELRQSREPQGAQASLESEELRRQLEQTVDEHFGVRTELRRLELRRVEMQLEGLRQAVDRIREDLERREQARESIKERRLRQLLGEQGDGW
jgi:hypothetical protein